MKRLIYWIDRCIMLTFAAVSVVFLIVGVLFLGIGYLFLDEKFLKEIGDR